MREKRRGEELRLLGLPWAWGGDGEERERMLYATAVIGFCGGVLWQRDEVMLLTAV